MTELALLDDSNVYFDVKCFRSAYIGAKLYDLLQPRFSTSRDTYSIILEYEDKVLGGGGVDSQEELPVAHLGVFAC